ncbi:MAG: GxxExxY protein [Planctomycetota bacterium]
MDDRLIYKEETYRVIGLCMKVHGILAKGYSETAYKGSLEYEFSIKQIPFSREKSYKIQRHYTAKGI